MGPPIEEPQRRRFTRANPNSLVDAVFSLSLPSFRPSLRLERDLSPIGRLTTAFKRTIRLNQRDQGNYFKDLVDEELNPSIAVKMASDTPLTVAEAATFYRDIDRLDDGKIKALTSSLLVTPLLRNVNSAMFLMDEPNTPVDVYDTLSGHIIVLGGYRGSVLRDSNTRRRAWIPVLKAGLNLKKINLLLGPGVDSEINSKDKFYADGMLTHIGPVDISKRLIKRLSANPNVTVHNWGYDWRLSLDKTSEELHQFIKSLNANGDVILIGHSMGGLVGHGAMVKDPSLIRGIIYAGTPLPCGNVLGPMRFTDQILLAKDFLTNEVNFMMRSSFVFVPRKELGLFRDSTTGEFIKDTDGQILDYWVPQTWVRWNGNPLVAGTRWRLDHHYELQTIMGIIGHQPDPKYLHLPDHEHNLYSGVSNYTGCDERVQHLIRSLKTTLPPGLSLTDVLPTNGVNAETERIVTTQIHTQAKLKISFNEAYAYLCTTLARTNDFINSLKFNPEVKYPKMVQIYSDSLPSVKFCIVDGPEAVKRGEYYNFFYSEGDGVGYSGWLFPRLRGTTQFKTLPPNSQTSPNEYTSEELQGFGYDNEWGFEISKRVKSEGGHIGLLTDLDIVADALNEILL